MGAGSFFFFEEENGVEQGWEERNREQRRKVKKFEWRTKRIPGALLYKMKPSIEKNYCESVKEDIFRSLMQIAS